MRVDIISIFPEYFAPLDLSLIGKARGSGLLDLSVHDLRTWTSDVHRTVDDTPYGGGPGMVMRPEPWSQAVEAVGGGTLVVPSPVGKPFTQADAHELAALDRLTFACGRYEGIDQRVLDEQLHLVGKQRHLRLPGAFVRNVHEVDPGFHSAIKDPPRLFLGGRDPLHEGLRRAE